MREAQFLRRSQFDEIQYGSAVLKRNGKGAILRPVITAHGHFRILKIRYPDVKTHIISHECFLRGAIITAWADQFRQQQGELWFVEEEISDSNADTPWHLRERHTMVGGKISGSAGSRGIIARWSAYSREPA